MDSPEKLDGQDLFAHKALSRIWFKLQALEVDRVQELTAVRDRLQIELDAAQKESDRKRAEIQGHLSRVMEAKLGLEVSMYKIEGVEVTQEKPDSFALIDTLNEYLT